jgi:hypothetical protein
MNSRKSWLLVLASAPVWPILWLLVFASLARVKLGFWPSYNNPDPKNLNWPIWDVPVFPLLLFAPLVLIGSLILAIYRWYTGRRDRHFLLTLMCFLALIAWLRFDPGGFVEWWAD